MPLNVGSRLGHYNVTALIGEGGMGQVYQATDTKLNRQVALKILPDEFASDADRLARFQREAQVLASLNHPNIAAIHGVEDGEGTKALVLELVEGPTLAARIAEGPIPVDEALPIAKQIAEALEAAHEAGVIHRDLKPANIKVRDDGTVKVLDFGLAKAVDTAPQGDPDESPTLTAAATQMGVIMGTAAYMSPEQARGKPVDKRADIWAFGAVLFEMLTGRRAFEGQDISVTLADVIRADPSWDSLPGDLSPVMATYLRRCLHKDTSQRVRDIGDVRLAIEGAFSVPEASVYQAASSFGAFGFRAVALTVSAAMLLSALVGFAVWQGTRRDSPSAIRTSVSTGSIVPRALTLSPDGTMLVYVGTDGLGVPQLYKRRLDQFDAVALPGTDGAVAPFFSPDGRDVGFADGGALKRVSLEGGRPTTVATIDELFRGGSWTEDGTIVFAVEGSGIWRVAAAGGTPVRLTEFADGETLHWAPEVTEGGLLLFTARLERASDRLIAQRLDSGERWTVGEGAAGRVTPGGHLLFERDGDLWAAAFGRETGRLAGEPGRVFEGLMGPLLGEMPLFTVARETGAVAYLPATAVFASLVWVDRDGRTEPLMQGRSDEFGHPRLSPDGTQLAMSAAGGVWVLDLERGGRTSIAPNGSYPLWMPDGLGVSFAVIPPDVPTGVYWRRADASAPAELILEGAIVGGGWAPNGQELAYWRYRNPDQAAARSNRDTGVMTSDGSLVLLADTSANERAARFSPDGRWIAYLSDESGRDEVYVQPYGRPGRRTLISTDGGLEPVWSADGSELFYREPGGPGLLAVRVKTEPDFTAASPELLFTGGFQRFGDGVVGAAAYDVSPDGQRFLMVVHTAGSEGVRVVMNWMDELARLAAGAR